MFGINFGTPKNKVEKKQEDKPSRPWKKYMTLFLAAALSLNAMAAESLSLTEEQKKQGIEFMKQSPEKVKSFENQLIEQAKKLPMVESKTSYVGQTNFYKEITLDDETVLINYKDQSGGVVVGIEARLKTKEGAYLRVVDGYENAKLDGKVDLVEAGRVIMQDNSSFFTTNSTPVQFVESKNSKGESLIRFEGLTPELATFLDQAGGRNTMYVSAQEALEDILNNVANSHEIPTVNL